MLEGAGIMQAFDARDGNFKTSGVYQGLTYHAGLSGGGWFVSSVAGNNYPTVSWLRDNLWVPELADSVLIPNTTTSNAALPQIVTDLAAKQAAGFNVTLVDPYGRFLSYNLLEGGDGGVATRLSSITGLSNFTDHNAPYPMLTATGVNVWEGDCFPGLNATQYEMHPYEWGSWDKGVGAFMNTPYIGTAMKNGKPVSSTCTKNFDNLGYVLGTSSNLLNYACLGSSSTSASGLAVEVSALAQVVDAIHPTTAQDLYATYRNPFAGYSKSSLVSSQPTLYLADGGESLQGNPIWPFIQKTKRADVLIVNDNGGDTDDRYPNGTEILTTYLQAKANGLTRMPFIPSVDTFVSKGLNKRATLFGCDEKDAVTIIYLPNNNYTYDSGQDTFKLEYTPEETRAMIANGVQIGLQNGAADWPTCLGCAMTKKTGGKLPKACTACFSKYCYRQ